MKVKFCCEKFEFRQSLPSEKGLNIRIVKYEPNQLLDKDNLVWSLNFFHPRTWSKKTPGANAFN